MRPCHRNLCYLIKVLKNHTAVALVNDSLYLKIPEKGRVSTLLTSEFYSGIIRKIKILIYVKLQTLYLNLLSFGFYLKPQTQYVQIKWILTEFLFNLECGVNVIIVFFCFYSTISIKHRQTFSKPDKFQFTVVN